MWLKVDNTRIEHLSKVLKVTRVSQNLPVHPAQSNCPRKAPRPSVTEANIDTLCPPSLHNLFPPHVWKNPAQFSCPISCGPKRLQIWLFTWFLDSFQLSARLKATGFYPVGGKQCEYQWPEQRVGPLVPGLLEMILQESGGKFTPYFSLNLTSSLVL